MVWEGQRLKRCAIGTLVVGILGAALLCLSFGSTSWLVFPPGYYFLPEHEIYMGLFGDRACIPDQCGAIPPSGIRQLTQGSWNTVLGLMCTTISITFMAVAMNIIILCLPKKIFTVCTALFWCSAGAMNVVSVVIFWHLFKAYQDRMNWSYWVSMISTIFFFAVGITLSLFACCHRWGKRPSQREPEDPVAQAPPPVVAYRSEGDDPDAPKYDFTADPDMQPYTFGGANRSGGGHSAAYEM